MVDITVVSLLPSAVIIAIIALPHLHAFVIFLSRDPFSRSIPLWMLPFTLLAFTLSIFSIAGSNCATLKMFKVKCVIRLNRRLVNFQRWNFGWSHYKECSTLAFSKMLLFLFPHISPRVLGVASICRLANHRGDDHRSRRLFYFPFFFQSDIFVIKDAIALSFQSSIAARRGCDRGRSSSPKAQLIEIRKRIHIVIRNTARARG